MTIDEKTEAELIELVRRAARAEILPRFRRLSANDVETKTGPEDLVTEADVRAEAMITEGVRALLPNALVIGEEAVEVDPTLLDGIADAELSVIIDPVDGTWNYAKGLTTFGVILAVAEKGETVFGVLYDPIVDDVIWARRGGGAWYISADGTTRRLSLDETTGAELTGMVPLFNFPLETRTALAGDMPGLRRIWSVRCSCHEYRTLAFGGADFVVSSALKPWDHAAGALIVTEAGGVARLMDGRPYRATVTSGGLLVAARNEAAFDQVCATLSPIFEP